MSLDPPPSAAEVADAHRLLWRLRLARRILWSAAAAVAVGAGGTLVVTAVTRHHERTACLAAAAADRAVIVVGGLPPGGVRHPGSEGTVIETGHVFVLLQGGDVVAVFPRCRR